MLKMLWEVRMKGKDGISRALYATVKPSSSRGVFVENANASRRNQASPKKSKGD